MSSDKLIENLQQEILAQNFPLLFATVSGAHLYGFESPDSDVDLRGVFVLPLDAVLGLASPQETVTKNFLRDGLEIDLVVHDLSKFCRLLTHKNGYVLEQLHSPWVVYGGADFEELKEISKQCFVKPVYFHYRGFLSGQIKQLAKESATVKDTLYGYRVALTGIHFLRTGEVQSHLPTLLEEYPQNGVTQLIEQKRAGVEKSPATALEFHRLALGELQAKLEQAHQDSLLPEELGSLKRLNDYIIRVRRQGL